MLIGIPNVALVQIVQALAIVLWLSIMLTAISARRRLPRTKMEPVVDVLMVLVLLVYALVMKIYFST